MSRDEIIQLFVCFFEQRTGIKKKEVVLLQLPTLEVQFETVFFRGVGWGGGLLVEP